MSTYAKLPGESNVPSKTMQNLSKELKEYDLNLKELRKLMAIAKERPTKASKNAVNSKQDELINIANSIRTLLKTQVSNNEKQLQENMKKTAEKLFKQFNELEQSVLIEDESYGRSDDIGPEFVESQEISYKDAGELDSDRLQERHENIQNLQKDFIEVNNLFKDVANLVEQQGEMLDESEKYVDTAVKETSRANVELESANTYQRSAKKKALCIFIIVLVVVGALVGIVVAVTA